MFLISMFLQPITMESNGNKKYKEKFNTKKEAELF